jgi:Resolvase, N terminal domain
VSGYPRTCPPSAQEDFHRPGCGNPGGLAPGSRLDRNHGKFVAYYRVSTNGQGKSGLGLDAQGKAVNDYLNGGSWNLVGEFTEIESGRNAARPKLQEALALCRAHRAALVVANVSRLTRSVAFLSKLLDSGVEIRFVDLPQIEGPTGKFMLQQMASVAELEAGMIGERTNAPLPLPRKNLAVFAAGLQLPRTAPAPAQP